MYIVVLIEMSWRDFCVVSYMKEFKDMLNKLISDESTEAEVHLLELECWAELQLGKRRKRAADKREKVLNRDTIEVKVSD